MKRITVFLIFILTVGHSMSQNKFSLKFDGSDDYMTLAYNYDTPERTIMLRLKVAALPSSLGYIYNSYYSGTTNGITQLGITSDTSLGFTEGGTYASVKIGLNKWYHVAITVNTLESKLYIDGIEVKSVAFTNNTGTGTALETQIGCSENYTNYFNGFIDELSIWTKALNSTKIKHYMDCPPKTADSGLIGYWDLNEGSGIVASDKSINAINGVLQNGVAFSSDIVAYNCGSSVQEHIHGNFRLYPNPVSSTLYLSAEEFTSSDLTYKIVDMNGAVIDNKTIPITGKMELDVSHIGAGTYFLVLNGRDGDQGSFVFTVMR